MKNELQDLYESFKICLNKTIEQRIADGFIKTYKPVLDDEPYRSFNTMKDYKKWCNEKLPKFLGMNN